MNCLSGGNLPFLTFNGIDTITIAPTNNNEQGIYKIKVRITDHHFVRPLYSDNYFTITVDSL